MRLRHPVDYTIETLARLQSELSNSRSGNSPEDVRDRWLRWWSTADSQLRNLFADDDIAAGLYITTEKIRGLNMVTLPYITLNRENDVWVERFGDLIAKLKALKPFTERPGRIVVPDTSAFIEGAYFTGFDWQSLTGAADLVRLVVPILVIEELDDLKRQRGDRVPTRARSVLHRLWELGATAGAAQLPGKPVTIEVFGDGPWHARRPVNDDEIVQRALAVGEITRKDVILVAGDYAMLHRGSTAGLKVARRAMPFRLSGGPPRSRPRRRR
jgi:hypothetical protein